MVHPDRGSDLNGRPAEVGFKQNVDGGRKDVAGDRSVTYRFSHLFVIALDDAFERCSQFVACFCFETDK